MHHTTSQNRNVILAGQIDLDLCIGFYMTTMITKFYRQIIKGGMNENGLKCVQSHTVQRLGLITHYYWESYDN